MTVTACTFQTARSAPSPGDPCCHRTVHAVIKGRVHVHCECILCLHACASLVHFAVLVQQWCLHPECTDPMTCWHGQTAWQQCDGHAHPLRLHSPWLSSPQIQLRGVAGVNQGCCWHSNCCCCSELAMMRITAQAEKQERAVSTPTPRSTTYR